MRHDVAMCSRSTRDGRQVTIRTATAEDVPSITVLVNEAYVVERFFKVGDRIDAPRVGALLETGIFLLLEREGQLAGSVYLDVREESGRIGLLSVRPSEQGRGLGRRLMDAAEDYARARGARGMELRVVNLREDLPPFYRKLGYVESGTEPFSDPAEATRPCHFVVMTKPLP